MKKITLTTIALVLISIIACKKEGCTDPTAINYNPEAKVDDGSCKPDESLKIPKTYVFERNGKSTVSYTGQTERLNQLAEMTSKAKSGVTTAVAAEVLHKMFSNEGGNGNGNFTFTSTKQLQNKCFATDVNLFKSYMDSIAVASNQNTQTASNGKAGVLTTGSKKYLVSANGFEYVQLMEKGLMGAVFMNQALNSYFGASKMDVDNTNEVNATEGKYYTKMEHHWDEAFGYFGVPVDFPENLGKDRFWGKYCNKRNGEIGCNKIMMDNFLKGRAAITQKMLDKRNEAIKTLRKQWEKISAAQAYSYLKDAKASYGNDNAKFIHVMSEAYAFILNLKYAPSSTRVMTVSEVESLLNNTIGNNFWTLTTAKIDEAITKIKTKYNL